VALNAGKPFGRIGEKAAPEIEYAVSTSPMSPDQGQIGQWQNLGLGDIAGDFGVTLKKRSHLRKALIQAGQVTLVTWVTLDRFFQKPRRKVLC
jgi:hypothetical protein